MKNLIFILAFSLFSGLGFASDDQFDMTSDPYHQYGKIEAVMAKQSK